MESAFNCEYKKIFYIRKEKENFFNLVHQEHFLQVVHKCLVQLYLYFEQD